MCKSIYVYICACVNVQRIWVIRQGWVLFKKMGVFTGIQFTEHFIEFYLVKTNQLFGSNSNAILTRQTGGKRSSRVAGSKRRALAFCFPVRIWYMLSISKCRGESDLGLCMGSLIAKRMPPRSADFRKILRPNTFLNRKSALRSGILLASTKLMHRPKFDSPLHFEKREKMINSYGKTKF